MCCREAQRNWQYPKWTPFLDLLSRMLFMHSYCSDPSAYGAFPLFPLPPETVSHARNMYSGTGSCFSQDWQQQFIFSPQELPGGFLRPIFTIFQDSSSFDDCWKYLLSNPLLSSWFESQKVKQMILQYPMHCVSRAGGCKNMIFKLFKLKPTRFTLVRFPDHPTQILINESNCLTVLSWHLISKDNFKTCVDICGYVWICVHRRGTLRATYWTAHVLSSNSSLLPPRPPKVFWILTPLSSCEYSKKRWGWRVC